MSESELRDLANAKQRYFVNLSRAAKELFGAMARPTGLAFRWLFLGDEGKALRWASRRVLRHLHHFCFVERPLSGKSSEIGLFALGVREGKRLTYLEIMQFLNLDDSQIRQLKEHNDD